jgi:hypothetical protein
LKVRGGRPLAVFRAGLGAFTKLFADAYVP